MKSLPLIFLGVFFTLAFSYTGIVLTSHFQMKDLTPVTAELVDGNDQPLAGRNFLVNGVTVKNTEGMTAYPLALVGEAQRGKAVYEQMGCLYCHSQQVRRKGFGSDFERGWGNRQSVPRDYIEQERVMLGTMRTGPDLTNVGARYPELWQYQHLYNPQITSPGSTMPPYSFLFEVQKINELTGPAAEALELPEQYHPGAGYEVVPTQRAKDLVAYLLNLSQDYELPEIKFTLE